MRICFVTLSLFLFCLGIEAQDLQDRDYQQRLERLNKRYEGFFLHQRDQQRFQVRRKSGVPELKASRKAYAKSRENARKNFVRQPPKDMEPLRIQWEAREAGRKKARDQIRAKFAKQQARLDQVEKSAKQIPGREELGIAEPKADPPQEN